MRKIVVNLERWSHCVNDQKINKEIREYEDKGFELDEVKVNHVNQSVNGTVDFHQTVTLVFKDSMGDQK